MKCRLINNEYSFDHEGETWYCDPADNMFHHAELNGNIIKAATGFIFSTPEQRESIITKGESFADIRSDDVITAIYKFDAGSNYVEFFSITLYRKTETKPSFELLRKIKTVALIRIMHDDKGLRAGITIAPGFPEIVMEFFDVSSEKPRIRDNKFVGSYGSKVPKGEFLARDDTDLRLEAAPLITIPGSVVTIYENYGVTEDDCGHNYSADGMINIVKGTYESKPALIDGEEDFVVIGDLAKKFVKVPRDEIFTSTDRYCYSNDFLVLEPNMKETDPMKLAKHYAHKAGYLWEWNAVIERTKKYLNRI